MPISPALALQSTMMRASRTSLYTQSHRTIPQRLLQLMQWKHGGSKKTYILFGRNHWYQERNAQDSGYGTQQKFIEKSLLKLKGWKFTDLVKGGKLSENKQMPGRWMDARKMVLQQLLFTVIVYLVDPKRNKVSYGAQNNRYWNRHTYIWGPLWS